LTQSNHLEFEPCFSPDGKTIVYVTWDDEEGGALYRLDWQKRGAKPEKISQRPGIYRSPAFSPNGRELVYVREKGNQHLGTTFGHETAIFRLHLQDGTESFVCHEGEYPQFTADGKRIGFQTGGHLFGEL